MNTSLLAQPPRHRRRRRFVRLHLCYLATVAGLSSLVVLLGYQLMSFAVHLRGLK